MVKRYDTIPYQSPELSTASLVVGQADVCPRVLAQLFRSCMSACRPVQYLLMNRVSISKAVHQALLKEAWMQSSAEADFMYVVQSSTCLAV